MNFALVVLMLAHAAPGEMPVREARGTLVDTAGNAVAGAQVVVTSEPDVVRLRRMLWLGRLYSDSALRRDMAAVTVAGESDAAGRFQIRLPEDYAACRFPDPLVLWIVQAGQLRAVKPLPRLVTSPGQPLVVGAVAKRAAMIELRTPEGEWLAGASVVPTVISAHHFPAELALRFTAHSDVRGRATLVGIELDTLDEVAVESPRFGQQQLRLEKTPDQPHGVARLAPVGAISGRLVTNADLSGLEIVAVTEAGGYAESGISGTASATCDRNGNFAFGPIAAGRVLLDINWRKRPDLTVRAFPPVNLVVEPNQRAQATIELSEAARVSGIVREQNDGPPLAGVQITVSGYDRYDQSAADGTYWGLAPVDADHAFAFPRTLPLPFVLAKAKEIAIDRSPGLEEVQFEPVEVLRGRQLAGRVVDEQGAGAVAWIEAHWISIEGYGEASYARSDRNGAFTLEGVHPSTPLRLKARNGQAVSGIVEVTERDKPLVIALERARRPRRCPAAWSIAPGAAFREFAFKSSRKPSSTSRTTMRLSSNAVCGMATNRPSPRPTDRSAAPRPRSPTFAIGSSPARTATCHTRPPGYRPLPTTATWARLCFSA